MVPRILPYGCENPSFSLLQDAFAACTCVWGPCFPHTMKCDEASIVPRFTAFARFLPRGRDFPRVGQRDAHSSEMALQVHSTLALFSGKRSVIPGPDESRRVMKDVLKRKC